MSISLQAAVELALQNTARMPEEWATTEDAAGRVLTRDIVSGMEQPPFDRSPLDGYAVIAADTAGAGGDCPALLTVVDKLYAGEAAAVPVLRGQAVRLMTGCMIPEGADCIVRQEDTDLGYPVVRIFREAAPGSNFCRRGEEYGLHQRFLSAGQKVDAAAAALVSGMGVTELPVRRRPRAVVFSTGDELQPPGALLAPGKIYDANTAYLTTRLRQLGGRPWHRGT